MSNPEASLLLSLAPELALLISDELDIESVKNLRLTCKQLAESLSNAILQSLTINLTKNDIEDGVSKLTLLAKSDHAAARATRKLCIRSLSPAYDPNYGGPSFTYAAGKWIRQPEPEDPPEVPLAERKVKANLYRAIASLKRIQTVLWVPCRKDPEWAQHAVKDALKEMPDLRQFSIRISDLKIPLPTSLHNLQAISVEGSLRQSEEGIYENLAKLIGSSPHLTSIDAAYSWDYGHPIDRNQSLHQLLKYCPRDSQSLKLRHLSLSNCLVRLDSVTLPHLSHLTSLELMSIEDPYFKSPHGYEEEQDSDAIVEKKLYGSRKDDIWKALTQAGIRLEEIIVEDVTPSFRQYLSTYSGIKRLCVAPRNFLDGHSSDEEARKFFATPFRNHCGSLQDLQIDAVYEGLWCFGEHNLSIVSKCKNLKTLSMAVISSQIQGGSEPVASVPPGKMDTIKQFLDIILIHMPRIGSVRIQAASPEELRYASCGNPLMEHYAAVTSQIAGSVNNYVAPLSCQRLPSLVICSERTTLVEVEVRKDSKGPGELLRYFAKVPSDERWY